MILKEKAEDKKKNSANCISEIDRSIKLTDELSEALEDDDEDRAKALFNKITSQHHKITSLIKKMKKK